MAIIKKKKVPYPISKPLTAFLDRYNRTSNIPIHYADLLRYENAISLYDTKGEDTLWLTVYYAQADMARINLHLKEIYAIMKADGDMRVIDHLFVDRVDLCGYGNTKPFRIRIVNKINDNFDYFYIKNADASRIYGLELEHLLSPNRVNYLVHEETLIEEHIAGIPGDMFANEYLDGKHLNKTRLAKEFVKFNERCFVRLLGDMHSSNFVIDITPDFEEITYRIRAIDFDQQSYEGRRAIYMPQYFKQNNPIIQVGIDTLTPETVKQYQKEERSLIATRLRASAHTVGNILRTMKQDVISTPENEQKLSEELATFYKDPRFLRCRNMGEILEHSLKIINTHPA